MATKKQDESKHTLLQASVRGTTASSKPQRKSSDGKEDYVLIESGGLPKASTVSQVPGLSLEELKLLYQSDRGRGEGDAVGTEKHKHFQGFSAFATISSAASSNPTFLNAIPQTTTTVAANGQRLGLQVDNTHVSIRAKLLWNNTTNSPTTSVGVVGQPLPIRCVVFWDEMPGIGATTWAENVNPAVGDAALMNTIAAGAGAAAEAYNSVACYNLNNHGTRYEVIYDKVMTPKAQVFGFNGSDVSGSGIEMIEIFIPLKHKRSTWFSTAGTNYLKNSLEIFFIADAAATQQDLPVVGFIVDLMYIDVGAA